MAKLEETKDLEQQIRVYRNLLLHKNQLINSLQHKLSMYEQKHGALFSSEDEKLFCEKKAEEDSFWDIDSSSSEVEESEISEESNTFLSADDVYVGENVVIDFVSDSPMFRQQLEGFQDSISGLKKYFKTILTQTKNYVSVGQSFAQSGVEFANAFDTKKYARALFSNCYTKQLGELSTVLKDFQDLLAQLQVSQKSLLLSLETVFFQPLHQFSTHEMKEAKKMQQELNQLAIEYEQLLVKSVASTSSSASNLSRISLSNRKSIAFDDLISRSSQFDVHKRESGLHFAKRRFELARFDLVRYLNRLDSRKKFVFLECIQSSLSAFKSYHHSCHELIASCFSHDAYKKENLDKAQSLFMKEDKMWSTQRLRLEFQLGNHFNKIENFADQLPLPSKKRVSSFTAPPSPSAIVDELDSPIELFEFGTTVEVVSSTTYNNRLRQEKNEDSVDKQGYLFLRSSSSLFSNSPNWKRIWCQIYNGKFYQISFSKSNITKKSGIIGTTEQNEVICLCDLLLSTVKDDAPDSSCSFEIVASSPQARFILQATSPNEKVEWMKAARKSTEKMLQRQSVPKKVGVVEGKIATDSLKSDVTTDGSVLVEKILSKNSSCADCSRTPANWVSINIGSLLCIECSGIHRSLGSHISKIRSITLDSVQPEVLQLILQFLGNEVVNSIWESNIPTGWNKPSAQASRDEKEKWIKAKYCFKGFTENVELSSSEVQSRFYQASQSGDVKKIMWCLAHGAKINQVDNGASALHLCAEGGYEAGCEYLTSNGASLDSVNTKGLLPYESAKLAGFEELKLILMQKMSLEQYHKT